MTSLSVPSWAVWVMAVAGILFALMLFVLVRRSRSGRSALAGPYALWMILFTIIPCLLIAYYAFTDSNGQFTLVNFNRFWDNNYTMNQQLISMGYDPSSMGLGRSAVNVDTLIYSLWLAFLCTAICLILGYPAALFMADRDFKLGTTIVTLFIVPMWMNFLLRTIAWMSLLEDNGLINTLLTALGFKRMQLMYNTEAVLLGMVYNYLPFMVFPIYNSISKQDYKLSEAAMDLGANRIITLFKVTMPLSLPGVVSGITMVFMPSVTTFFIPRVLGGGNTEMFGDLIERTFLTEGNWNVGSALSLIMMLMILLSLGLLRKVDPEGEGAGMI